MHRRLVHFVLIFMLAITPLQTALASLVTVSHETKCEMNEHDMSMHEGMQHDQAGPSAASDSCECCDCGSPCLVPVPVATVAGSDPSIPYLASTQAANFTPAMANSQYPPTELRPPIALH
ncbi:MAG: hypothetical protein PVF75_00915 [Granulosicoccaceae bacterium]